MGRPEADIMGGCGEAQPPHAPPQNTVCLLFLGSYVGYFKHVRGFAKHTLGKANAVQDVSM